MQTWLNELAAKRLAQRTNVYFVESFDMKRLQQFKEVAKNSQLKELFKTEFANVVGYNIQRNELTNLKTQRKLSLDPMTNPLKESDNFLLGSASIVVLDYIFTQPHADALSDYLAAWSQDPNLYAHKSTVLVFTSDVNLFNETLRRLCYTITIPASTVEERRELLEKVADEITEGFKQKYDEKLNVKINEDIIQASSGLDLHSVETAALESFFLNRQINVPAFTEYKIKILQTYNLSYVVPHIDFSLVGGYELLKQYMRNRVIRPLRNPEKAKYYGVGLPRGILLYGIPGTGNSVRK